MVPFYGLTSWLSLMYRDSSIYFDVPRDWWVCVVMLSVSPGQVTVGVYQSDNSM